MTRTTVCFAFFTFLGTLGPTPLAIGQVVNLGPVPIADSTNAVRLEQVGTVSGGTQQMAFRGDKFYFANRSGVIEEFTKEIDGSLTNEPGNFLDVAGERGSFFSNTSGFGLNGLRGIAFHPGFDDPNSTGFGKFYTQHNETTHTTPTHDLRPSWATSPSTGIDKPLDSVLFEWDFGLGGAIQSTVQSSREVYRVRFPAGHHVGQQIAFNPTVSPGDPDYGNLYLTFGESGGKNDAAGQFNFSSDTIVTSAPQDPLSILGKIVRINPLQDGADPFTIPTNTNPFPGDPNTLPEIYAAGFRNPQTLSFDTATGRLFVGDIGQKNVEEINLVEAGGNYGWSQREGTYRFDTPFDSSTLVEDDLATRQADGFIDPVAQFDHVDGGSTQAVVGGFVYQGTMAPQLNGKYLFSSLSLDRIYIADESDLVNDDDPASFFRLPLIDEFGNPTSLGSIVGSGRANIRFGQDGDGEVYVISKANGGIYRFEGPSLVGDYDSNGVLNSLDWQYLRDNFGTPLADLDENNTTDVDDFSIFKQSYITQNGLEAFESLNSVPEPSAFLGLMFIGALCPLVFGRRL